MEALRPARGPLVWAIHYYMDAQGGQLTALRITFPLTGKLYLCDSLTGGSYQHVKACTPTPSRRKTYLYKPKPVHHEAIYLPHGAGVTYAAGWPDYSLSRLG